MIKIGNSGTWREIYFEKEGNNIQVIFKLKILQV